MINFKHGRDVMLFSKLNPILIMIFSDLWNYAYETHNIHLTVTETISTYEEDMSLGRVSDSHRTKRAIDIRTKDLPSPIVQDLIEYINSHDSYEKYRYVSRSGVKRLAYWHDSGNGEHLHLAIHSKFAIK